MKRATLSLVIALTLLFSGVKAQWHSMNGPQGRYVRSILCTDSLYYAATGGGVLVSSDQGLNWEFRNDGLTSCDTKCLVTYNDTVFLATDENIFRSIDGGLHWTPDPYLHNHYIKHILVHNGTLLASTYIQGVYQSTEGTQGEYLTGVFPGDVRYPYFMADNEDAMFIATYRRGVYRSFDNGASWEPCNNGLSSDVLGIYCHNGKVFATVLGQGVMASSNNGGTWTSANLNKQAKGYAHLGDTLYAACIGQGVFASFDNGVTWHDFNTNLAPKNLWCMDAHNGHLFVGDTYGRIYRGNSLYLGTRKHGLHFSDDMGATWQSIDALPDDATIRRITTTDTIVAVGCEDGSIYVKYDHSDEWVQLEAIPVVGPILDICIDGERLYASPMAGGIWYTELPAMPDDVAESYVVMLSIAPNPATTSITITASETLNDAELTMYDLQGRACYGGMMLGSRHEIPVYGLPSGIYFVKVAGSHGIAVKKVAIRH